MPSGHMNTSEYSEAPSPGGYKDSQSPLITKDSKHRAAKLAIEVMEMSGTSTEVIINSLNTIRTVSFYDDCRGVVGDLGACRSILSVIKNHLFSEDMIKNCCEALSSLVYETKSNIKLLFENYDATSIIERMLQYHMHSQEEILQIVCLTIRNLSVDRLSCEKFLESPKFIQLIISTCEQNLSKIGIAESLCATLLNLTKYTPIRSQIYFDENICNLIKKILHTYKENPLISEILFTIIANLSKDEEHPDIFDSINIYEDFPAISSYHLFSETTINAILSAIVNLSSGYGARSRRHNILNSHEEMISILLRALHQHLSSKFSATLACECIRNLSCEELGSKLLGTEYTCELLIQITKIHLECPDVILICCEAITQLCLENHSNRLKFNTLGVSERIIEIFINYVSNPVMVNECCVCLGALLTDATDAMKKNLISTSPVCEILVKAILIHKDNRQLRELTNHFFWLLIAPKDV